LAAIAVKTDSIRTIYYAHTDHLGSIRLLTTSGKGIQSRSHYDAWGVRTLAAGTSITNRGFTGHEHLPMFGLINMNARLYDPMVGRFLAMDPFVQMPDYTQAFNRYTYALNNPLIYVDPDGEYFLIDDLIAAAIGAGLMHMIG
jgi:RHS repeat-associated protein